MTSGASGTSVVFSRAPALPEFIREAFPFDRRMASIGGKKIHFVDHGSGPVVLLMHGNPTWSYLWRHVIKGLTGCRVIAPDLPGLGLSHKPRRVRDHSLRQNVSIMTELAVALDLRSMTLVGQDWGGPVVTGVGEALPDRVHGLVLANTSVLRPTRPFRPKPFHRFSHMPVLSDVVFRGFNFPIPILHRVQGDRDSLTREKRRAYEWPLRKIRDRAAPLALARMVPNAESHPSTKELDRIGGWVESFSGPAALVWGTQDPILGRALNRQARALPHATVRKAPGAGHFLQEEVPELLVEAIREVIAK